MSLAWIAVDWGTSNLRLWLMDGDGGVLESRQSTRGMAGLARDEFEPVLLDLVDEFLPHGQTTPVICCGMVGSAQGWREAAYARIPCPPPGTSEAIRVEAKDPRLDVAILPGIQQTDPPDVMRGEETQICGFLAARNGYAGTICLPGTHTKWAAVSEGRIERFQTCMTGEIFALLSGQSVLRHSLGGDGLSDDAFLGAAKTSLTDPAALPTELFRIRAASLVHNPSPDEARGRLSGLLIGAELAAAKSYWQGHPAAIVGAGKLARLYSLALAAAGCEAETVDAESLTLDGLRAAYLELGS